MIVKMKDAVVAYAQEHVGFKEFPGNQGFKDAAFDTKMRQVGFENGWAWCALFAELCWSMPTYDGKWKVFQSISDNFSANAVRTYDNFYKDETGLFRAFDNKMPEPGDVVIWEKRKGGIPKKTDIWTIGHAGIVESASETEFVSIEGNSNDAGGREGIEVARKTRTYTYKKMDGLALKGFITCKV
jgi:hypothetical protein